MNQRLTTHQVGLVLAALKSGAKQKEVAARFGISQSYVSRLKNKNRRRLTIREINHKSPRIMTLKRSSLNQQQINQYA